MEKDYDELIKNMPDICEIKQVVIKFHKGQTDLVGGEYFGHIERVYSNTIDLWNKFIIEYVKKNGNFNHTLKYAYYFDIAAMTAYCHDLLEDTDITEEQLIEEYKIPEEAVSIVKEYLTHDKKRVSYKDYIEHIKENPIAALVKLADLSDNLDMTRFHGRKLEEKDFKRIQKYIDSYHTLYEYLIDFKII